ncbi:hypothetical protein [[Eubacterium] hominis]|uniref:hypothetical protein n=1 Tax=[Eubacterium] hominis TaxID=2764325 RepID=UPI003A4E20DF
MSAGTETKNKMRSCIANKQGFVSAYALAMLCIIMSLVSLCVLQIQLCTALLEETSQHEFELALLHHVKSKLKEEQPKKASSEQEEDIEPIESFRYKNTKAEIRYETDSIKVIYQIRNQTQEMHITINEHKEMMDIQYS